jgi:hypothetical protein
MADDDVSAVGPPLDITPGGFSVSPDDLDLMARTMIGEAPAGGRSAVANVILNRAYAGANGLAKGAGDFPNNISDVIARGGFESWRRSGRYLRGISTDDPDYLQAYSIAKSAAMGLEPDPTNGATFFWSPRSQAAFGRNPPRWARNNPPVAVTPDGQQYHTYPGAKPIVRPGAPMTLPAPDTDPTAGYDLGGAHGPGVGAGAPGAPTAATAPAPATPYGVTDMALPPPPRGADDPLLGFDLGPHTMTTPLAPPPSLSDAAAAAVRGAPGGTAAAAGAGFLGGFPFIGPTLQAGAQELAARMISGAHGVPLDQARAQAGAILGANAGEHPYATTAGGLAGGLAGGVAEIAPMIAAAPAAFGVAPGMSLGARIGASALTNAGIGGVDTAIRGGNPLDIGRSALIGGAVGAGAPFAGQVVGSFLRGMIPGSVAPANAAERQLMAAMQGMPPGALTTAIMRMRANPRLSPMDVLDPMQYEAQGLAASGGEPRNVLNQFDAARRGSAGSSVSGAYDQALGMTPDVEATLAAMKARAKANASAGFGAALAGARPVNVQPVLDAIDKRLTPGVNSVVSTPSRIPPSATDAQLLRMRAQLAGPDGQSMLTDADALHRIQSEWGQLSRSLGKSADGWDRMTGGAMGDIRSELVDALDQATGGRFKPAQAQFKDDMDVQDAFFRGNNVLKNAPTDLENRPEYWRSWVAQATPEELAAARLGARTAVSGKMGAVRNAPLTGEAIADSDFNTQRLEALLGKPETDALTQAMADAKAERATSDMLFRNSQTAMREESALRSAITKVTGRVGDIMPSLAGAIGSSYYGLGPLLGAAGGAGLTAATRLIQRAAARADMARNVAKASILSSSGPRGVTTMQRLGALMRGQGVDRIGALMRGQGVDRIGRAATGALAGIGLQGEQAIPNGMQLSQVPFLQP